MIASTFSTLPSTNATSRPRSSEMFGFIAMSPDPTRTKKIAGDRRVRLPELVVGRGQSVVLHAADREPRRCAARSSRARAAGAPRGSGTALSSGLPRMYFGNHPRAAARRDPDLLRDAGAAELGRDVHRAVAHADHDHAFTDQIVRFARDRCSGASASGARQTRPETRVPANAAASDGRWPRRPRRSGAFARRRA